MLFRLNYPVFFLVAFQLFSADCVIHKLDELRLANALSELRELEQKTKVLRLTALVGAAAVCGALFLNHRSSSVAAPKNDELIAEFIRRMDPAVAKSLAQRSLWSSGLNFLRDQLGGLTVMVVGSQLMPVAQKLGEGIRDKFGAKDLNWLIYRRLNVPLTWNKVRRLQIQFNLYAFLETWQFGRDTKLDAYLGECQSIAEVVEGTTDVRNQALQLLIGELNELIDGTALLIVKLRFLNNSSNSLLLDKLASELIAAIDRFSDRVQALLAAPDQSDMALKLFKAINDFQAYYNTNFENILLFSK